MFQIAEAEQKPVMPGLRPKMVFQYEHIRSTIADPRKGVVCLMGQQKPCQSCRSDDSPDVEQAQHIEEMTMHCAHSTLLSS